ncbi:hypothetical protein EDB19DRAFT_1825554 [Suillus lakei]|nr:hypothetical protein EDB19DRAFT_1825554 [Suillus lakei]
MAWTPNNSGSKEQVKYKLGMQAQLANSSDRIGRRQIWISSPSGFMVWFWDATLLVSVKDDDFMPLLMEAPVSAVHHTCLPATLKFTKEKGYDVRPGDLPQSVTPPKWIAPSVSLPSPSSSSWTSWSADMLFNHSKTVILTAGPTSSTPDLWVVNSDNIQDTIDGTILKLSEKPGPSSWLNESCSVLFSYHALFKVSVAFQGGKLNKCLFGALQTLQGRLDSITTFLRLISPQLFPTKRITSALFWRNLMPGVSKCSQLNQAYSDLALTMLWLELNSLELFLHLMPEDVIERHSVYGQWRYTIHCAPSALQLEWFYIYAPLIRAIKFFRPSINYNIINGAYDHSPSYTKSLVYVSLDESTNHFACNMLEVVTGSHT